MTSDQEPRYRLVDSNGVIRGTLYGKPDGSVAIQETDSGADREVALAPDGTFSAPSVETESVSTEQASITDALDATGLDLDDESHNSPLLWLSHEASNFGRGMAAATRTIQGDNSASTIYEGTNRGNFYIVHIKGPAPEHAVDIILTAGGNTITVVDGLDRSLSNRSYSYDSGDNAIELAIDTDESDDYDVFVSAQEGL